jgi:hypothetical protein
MTDLAVEYFSKDPHFIVGGGRTDIWVVDDHNLIARSRAEDGKSEEWCKLYKEWDCWWLTRMDQEKKTTSSVLKPDQMNAVDSALTSYLLERELL